MARLRRRAVDRRSSASRRRRPTLAASCSRSALTVALDARLYNAAALVHARARSSASCRRRSCPTYNVFYEARIFARGAPGLHGDGATAFPSAISSSTSTSRTRRRSRSARTSGRPTGRCAAAATRAPRSSSTSRASPFRLGVVETRREMIATRAADNQCVVAYCNLVRRQRRAHLRRRRLRRAERPRRRSTRRAFARASPRSRVDLDRTRRLRNENTTWRDDRERFAAETPHVRRVSA